MAALLPPGGQTKWWKMDRVQNCNLHIRPSSQEKLSVIHCIGSTDLVKITMALNKSAQNIFISSRIPKIPRHIRGRPLIIWGGRGAKPKKKNRSEGRQKKIRPRGLRKKLCLVNFFCVFPAKPCYLK